MEIPEKIKKMRMFLELSRPKFCEMTDIPLGTLKNVEITGASPRADILAKMIRIWPGYAKWLLTDANYDIQPSNVFRVIDVVDARYMSECVVEPSHMGKLIFIQATRIVDGELEYVEHKLGALITIPKNVYVSANELREQNIATSLVSAIWVSNGAMSFFSEHGGRLALQTFCKAMENLSPNITKGAELVTMDESDMAEIVSQMVVREHWLKTKVNEEFNDFVGI